MFIKKLDLAVDLEQVKRDTQEIISKVGWGDINQISLVHRPSTLDPNEQWRDGTGSLFENGKKIIEEAEFSVINEKIPEYTKQILNDLAVSQNIKIGRTRLMNLPYNQGLGVHRDESERYHLAIVTHNYAYIANVNSSNPMAICYHIPDNCHFYKVNTTLEHFVFNGYRQPRIHLVICPRN